MSLANLDLRKPARRPTRRGLQIAAVVLLACVIGFLFAFGPRDLAKLVAVGAGAGILFVAAILFLDQARRAASDMALRLLSVGALRRAGPGSVVVSRDDRVIASLDGRRPDAATLSDLLSSYAADPATEARMIRLRTGQAAPGSPAQFSLGRDGHATVRKLPMGGLLVTVTDTRGPGGGLVRPPAASMIFVVEDNEGTLDGAVEGPCDIQPDRILSALGPPPWQAGQTLGLGGPADWVVTDVGDVTNGVRLTLVPVSCDTTWSDRHLAEIARTIDALPVPLLRLTGDNCVADANAPARDLLGLAPGERADLADLIEGPGRPLADWIAEAASGHGLDRSEVVRATRDGHEGYIQVAFGRIGPDAKAGLLAILMDATELKTLEAQFVQSQKMQAIGQLAGGVAHDFNNLLTAIGGHADLLLLRHDESDADYADLMQITQNANRAAALVGQLLAFSRKQRLTPELLNLRDTMSELTHLLNRLVGEKISLALDHDPALRLVRADKRQFEQVMMNLVVNARDAMPDGGRIFVQTRNERLSAPEVRGRVEVPAGDYVVVRVIDEGMGIEPERLNKIFEPFYTSKRPGEGTGLGLSTAYGIVKQTGGFIFAESALGAGSTFSIMLPARDAAAAPDRPRREPSRAPVAACDSIVLLVEDEAPVRAFAARALRMKGFTVLEADSAEAALDILADPELSIDVFVTDVVMPGLDGPTWVRSALRSRPDTRVVFMSGYADHGPAAERARIPNSAFLAKPFSLKDLVAIVQDQAR